MVLQRRVVLLALAATISACGIDVSQPLAGIDPPASPLIVDGANNGGNPHFYFLPPLVPSPAHTGVFDGSFSPIVRVCEWNGSACVLPYVAEFTTGVGANGEVVKANQNDYSVNWKVNDFAITDGVTYRITASVGTTAAIVADVVFGSGSAKNGATGDPIPLTKNRTIPLKFRIEQGVLCGAEERCAEQSVGVGGGTVVTATGDAGLTIPAGALTAPIHVALVRREATTCFPLGTAITGVCHEIVTDQPAGFTLNAPATVGICTTSSETDATPRLIKTEPSDPLQAVTVLTSAPAPFLQCAGGASQPVGGLASSFSYVAPSLDGTWSTVAGSARFRGVATALAPASLLDPRNLSVIVVTGGLNQAVQPVGQVDAYITPSFAASAAGSLLVPRYAHTATYLQSGGVLITGGIDASGSITNHAEIYRLSTMTSVATGSMVHPRANHTATLLPDGRVLLIGGITQGGLPALTSAEIFDPATGTFTHAGDMTTPRHRHTANLLPQTATWGVGAVVVMGGDGGAMPGQPTVAAPVVSSMEVFRVSQPLASRFQHIDNLNVARRSHTTTWLPQSSVFAVVGGTDGVTVHANLELWNPFQDRVTNISKSLPVGVTGHDAQLTTGDNILVAGGATDPASNVSTPALMWIEDRGPSYSADLGSRFYVYRLPDLPDGRRNHSAAHILGNALLVTGGVNGPNSSPTFLTTSVIWRWTP